jgi:hypothetical protein
LSACQLISKTNEQPNSTHVSSYGEYYLRLKSLSKAQLKDEIKQQESDVKQGEITAKINLLLLRSLPNSPIYNVYSAKSLLNNFQFSALSQQLSLHDLALITLLKDQLNAQLFLYQDLAKNEQLIQQNNHQVAKQMQTQQLSILQLNKKINVLQLQINQLKKIEETISEHDK